MGRFTDRLRALARRRTAERNRTIIASGQAFDRWTRSIERDLLGVINAGRGGVRGVTQDVTLILAEMPADAAALMEKTLLAMWSWSWDSAVDNWLIALPLDYWVARLSPAVPINGPPILAEQASGLDAESQIDRIINGEVSDEEAREIVRELEFPQPSREAVDAIIRGTHDPDGIDAMSRIKTVLNPEIGKLREIIVGGYSTITDDNRASVLEQIALDIRPLLADNQGVNWKAKRIARTESVRIAEAGLRASWEPIEDLIQGLRSFTANDEKVQDSHKHFENKLYLRTSTGEFIARDGERVPAFPIRANCRGWTTPELLETAIEREMNAGPERAPPKRKAPAKKKVPKRKPTKRPTQPLTRSEALKTSLADIEKDIVSGKKETGVLLDADGRELVRRTGDTSSVPFTTQDTKHFPGSTLTHNHPSIVSRGGGRRMTDIPPSGADGQILIDHGMREVRAVSKDATYSITVKPGASPRNISSKWRRAVDKRHTEMSTLVIEDARKKGPITEKGLARINQEIFQRQAAVQHEVWLENADRWGLVYERTAR